MAEGEGWSLGFSVADGADIDGAGLPDLVVGATGADDRDSLADLMIGADQSVSAVIVPGGGDGLDHRHLERWLALARRPA